MVDAQAYACLRLAGERGMSMEPLRAAEVLDGEGKWSPLDKSYWRLPYQKDIQKWLENSE